MKSLFLLDSLCVHYTVAILMFFPFPSSLHSLVCWRWSPIPLESKKSLPLMTCRWPNNTTEATDMAAMAGIHAIMDTDIRAAERTMGVITVHTDTADPSKIKTLLNNVTALTVVIPRTVLTEDVQVIPAVVMAQVTRVIRAITLAIWVTLPVIMAVDTDTIDSLIRTNLICSWYSTTTPCIRPLIS